MYKYTCISYIVTKDNIIQYIGKYTRDDIDIIASCIVHIWCYYHIHWIPSGNLT